MSTSIVDNVDETIATWQAAIYQECLKVATECGAVESSIDGAGSDGDELAFTLAEIGQAFNLLRDERDAARAQVQRLREAAQRIIDDYTWDDVNKDVEAWVSSQYLYSDIVTLRDALRDTEPQP